MFYNQRTDEVALELKSDLISGLTGNEAQKRMIDMGQNVLQQEKPTPVVVRFLRQFEDFMIWILIGASVISFFTHEIADGFIILTIVLLNGVLGFVQENNAEKSMQALKNMQVPNAQVVRDGQVIQVPSPLLVPGDLVRLNAGDVIPADGRLIEAASLSIEEAQLTGESVPVNKQVEALQNEDLSIGDRKNMAYATSRVTSGRGSMLVTATGMNTEIGKIADLLNQEEEEKTPLQVKLAELGKMLGIGAMIICALIFVIGYLQGRDMFEMLMIAISLAVAAIPEGLPAIVTIVLAMGVNRMISSNAIVRKLPAVETLGSASVICSDKTGTLTQNKMTVTEIYTDEHKKVVGGIELTDIDRLLLKTGVLCNDASVVERDGKDDQIGDPTETALLTLGNSYDLTKKSFEQLIRIAEVPFDSDRKMMSTLHREKDGVVAYVKGAPDQMLSKCSTIMTPDGKEALTEEARQQITARISEMSARALRVLAFAVKTFDELPEDVNVENVEKDLTFVGLMGMIDPPREEVKSAVATATRAGIRTVMITGDYKDTAVAIATELGILKEGDRSISGTELNALSEDDFLAIVNEVSVYARVSPSHKVRIVKALKAKGQIVAMTGDGVNDAPALKGADIGCAMGITGTDVSKEASDLILTDDNFTTIVSAVKEGRTIYDNIKKSVNFLLASNMGEIFTLLIAISFGLPMPLLAIHILWINLVTDSFPALALGVEHSEPDLMTRKPRNPDVSILGEGLILDILLQGIMIGALSLSAFKIGLKDSVEAARTMTFLTLSMSQLVHSFNVRSRFGSVLKLGIFSNKRLNQGTLLSFFALMAVYLIPQARSVFKLTWLSSLEVIATVGLAITPLIIMETYKFFRRN